MSKAGYRFSLHGNAVLINLLMKRLAERNHIMVRVLIQAVNGRVGIEPEPHTIEEVKTAEVDEPGPAWSFLRSEKDCGREDALKPIDHALIVRPILWQVKEIEHSSSRIEMDRPTFLLQSEGRNPYGN